MLSLSSNLSISFTHWVFNEAGQIIKILLKLPSIAAIIDVAVFPNPLSRERIAFFLESRNLTPCFWASTGTKPSFVYLEKSTSSLLKSSANGSPIMAVLGRKINSNLSCVCLYLIAQ